MTTSLFRALQAKLWRRQHNQKGFTLVEVLIVTLIAGGIVSGLMFLVVELLTADQRDASRNATQQDMQRSLDYMSTELRDAVYVYSGDCLYGSSTDCPRSDNKGILDYLPVSLNSLTSRPVLAFWKQAPLPSSVLAYCSAQSGSSQPIRDSSNKDIPCIAGHAYSLVVYSLDTRPDSVWNGKARITRYELRPYENQSGIPNRVAGYVVPIIGSRNLFASWPLDLENNSQQTARPTGSAAALTDFVDVATPGETPSCPGQTAVPPEYEISPPTANAPDSFYACVNVSQGATSLAPPPPGVRTTNDEIENQEVILYLRGNGFGRPGINDTGNSAYRPTLTTRVFNRGTLDINPAQQGD